MSRKVEISRFDPIAFASCHGAFEDVFELPDITREGIIRECLHRLLGDPRDGSVRPGEPVSR